MKKYLLAVIFFGLGTLGRAQLVTIDFTAGILTTAGGAAPIADGSLFQVIGSPDNIFSSPTSGAFIGGNDVLLFTGSFDSSPTATPGATAVLLSNVAAANDFLMIRWYPTLTNISASPGFSTSYGEYSYLNDNTWVAPATGSLSYTMLTLSSGGGSVPDSAGFASLTTAAVPEPSTYAAFAGVLSLGFAAWRRRSLVRA